MISDIIGEVCASYVQDSTEYHAILRMYQDGLLNAKFIEKWLEGLAKRTAPDFTGLEMEDLARLYSSRIKVPEDFLLKYLDFKFNHDAIYSKVYVRERLDELIDLGIDKDIIEKWYSALPNFD